MCPPVWPVQVCLEISKRKKKKIGKYTKADPPIKNTTKVCLEPIRTCQQIYDNKKQRKIITLKIAHIKITSTKSIFRFSQGIWYSTK